MSIDRQRLKKMLAAAAARWAAEADTLSDIDSRFGDGDHGVTIKKISTRISQKLPALDTEDFGPFFEFLGDEVMAISGGSAGPLYGTMIGAMAEGVSGEVIDGPILKKMIEASLKAMCEITKARRGDKTMMDALMAAAEAAAGAEGGAEEILRAAAAGAAEGAKDTENQVSKYGRARSYGEKTIGTPDAGAVSTSLFFQGLLEGYLE